MGPDAMTTKEYRMKRRDFLLTLPAFATAPGVFAAAWPSAKPIRYVVPFAPGGTTDVLARLLAPKLQAAIGQNFIVDNRAGAGGVLGADAVAKSPPDGYTILGGTISTQAINPALQAKMPYNAERDLVPITMIGSTPNVVIVPANSPYKTMQELLEDARKKPGRLTHSSAGTGTSQHMSGELLKQLAKVFVVHIPYRGSGPAIQDVIGGQVTMGIDTLVVAAPHIKSGTLRALAVTTARRARGFESIPTIGESGVPGYDVASWQSVHAPAGTPAEITQQLSAEFAKAMKLPDVQERFAFLGLEAQPMTPAELGAFEAKERAKWAKVVKDGGIKPE
jgi:tripartite-type tricarboxylate transporter receptor subunit TctC